jgi:hypothetical protein
MSPSASEPEMVDVHLRYRPVGDVLTMTVDSDATAGPRFHTELDDDTLVEWTRRPDGTTHILAVQLLDARSRVSGTGPIEALPAAFTEPALDLLDPGHRHRHHPSSHRPTNPVAAHSAVVRVAEATFTDLSRRIDRRVADQN